MNKRLEVTEGNVELEVCGENLILSPQKAVFWKQNQSLWISDLHLGKAGHFRKHGVPIPRAVHHADLTRISQLIQEFAPARILFMGDLFHSEGNEEWQDFVEWRHTYPSLEMLLIEGNHDILERTHYQRAALQVADELAIGPFVFTHEKQFTSGYNISGHVHPCVRMQGLARQGVRLPCFYFSSDHALLPAFGGFTGTHPVKTRKNDRVIGVSDGYLISLMA
ncbi:ligase-associated DNA damage response endonuclease PdeM [Marinoscillum furvescens]|nr:ligase-associated DNA damage response endonuclease PdeM [Marinoscillum furvescens]